MQESGHGSGILEESIYLETVWNVIRALRTESKEISGIADRFIFVCLCVLVHVYLQLDARLCYIMR
jgi:hypothetical protein